MSLASGKPMASLPFALARKPAILLFSRDPELHAGCFQERPRFLQSAGRRGVEAAASYGPCSGVSTESLTSKKLIETINGPHDDQHPCGRRGPTQKLLTSTENASKA